MELINNRPRKASKFTQEQCVTDNSGVNDVLGTDSNVSNKPRGHRTIKLHIGNLSSSTQPSMLYEYFTDLYGYASVLECVIPPGHPYPYGLVTMLEEYARDVLKCGQKHELDGRVLKVTKSVQVDEKPVKTPATPSSLRCPNCGYHSRWCTCVPTFVPYTATAPYIVTAQDKESVGRTNSATHQQQEENLSTDLENPEMKPRIKLPEGWACIWSKSKNRWYFFHNRTNKSVWDIEVIRNKKS
jgi:RNA recognition motif-containing protein